MVFWLLHQQMSKETSRGTPSLKENVAERNFGARKHFSCNLQEQLCVWKALIPQLVKVSTDSHVCLSEQHQGFQMNFKRISEVVAGKWCYKYNLMVLRYVKDRTAASRVHHCFKLLSSESHCYKWKFLYYYKYECFKKLNLIFQRHRSGQEQENWTPHKRLKPLQVPWRK